jgi:flagellar motor switch protein FliM
MAGERVLTQEEIDSVFRKRSEEGGDDASRKAQVYDFRRPDRIAKDQLRAIHLLHENFARSLASSMSAYLRAYVAVNLVSVEQLAFVEFTQTLASPTCLVILGMQPFDGNTVLEISPSLAFPVLEMLLGGTGQGSTGIDREMTEIEQSIMESLLRVILQDLRNAWQAVTAMDFSIDSYESEPSLLQILAPNEAVVAISVEIRIGETAGIMNMGIPSIIVKMLRQKFDQQWSVRKAQSTDGDHHRILRLLRPASIRLDARLQGPTMRVDTLLALEPGDVLGFDYPLDRPLDVMVNGKLKHRGEIVKAHNKRALHILEPVVEP